MNQINYERYIVSKAHDYTRSLMFRHEFNTYLPKWEKEGFGSTMWRRCSNVDCPKGWDMKTMTIKGEDMFGPNGSIYTLYILGYISLSLHKFRARNENLANGWNRWWCRRVYHHATWRPLWGKLTQQRAHVLEELANYSVLKRVLHL